jgi:hypothetical protein
MAAHKCHWLILSYRSNIDGSACAQHIDDRLPFFEEKGVVPVLLTGPIGNRFKHRPHLRSWSIAPSGIRFELRHFLRKRFSKRWQFKTVETLFLLPVLPFYLLEKIIINLESEWSWFFLASIQGYFLCRRYRPEVIYSTGGTASAHVAARFISRATGLPWLAETQDPLVHDHDWSRSQKVRRIYEWLEQNICANADSFIFLTQAARKNMGERAGMPHCGKVIYPGSNPAFFHEDLYVKGPRCHFAHFGTLAGSRNLVVFIKALSSLVSSDQVDRDLVRIDIYGSLDSASLKSVKEMGMEDLVIDHGSLPRREALTVMQKTDCLLLIQNTIYFSSETIPSKVYEYILSGRPVLGLLYHNGELTELLHDEGNFVAPADDPEAVATEVKKIVDAFRHDVLPSNGQRCELTVAKAVDQLISLGEDAAKRVR